MPPSEAWEQALPLLLALCFLSFGFGYLLGSIPFGLILAKLAGLGDLRQIGSGNIGATNVLRTGNKALAALTLLLDLLKGTAAVWVGSHFGPYAAMAAGLGAFLGHLFPVWLGFHGGKGVATYLGVLLGLYWPAAAAFSVVWLLVAFATRYSSLAALVASAASVGMLVLTGQWRLAGLFLLLTLLLFIRHAANIGRLAKGEEARIGERTV
ncbi:MAG TPA: glycerol-3-phosphate 1-O-acyltransferase PlsY [Methyloceanibacter sp.]|nr:glycerol-3-phosphate 1-O-acyltransferase PlsY [Methyloceanibacter sp.]